MGQVFQQSHCVSGDGRGMGGGDLIKVTDPAVTGGWSSLMYCLLLLKQFHCSILPRRQQHLRSSMQAWGGARRSLRPGCCIIFFPNHTRMCDAHQRVRQSMWVRDRRGGGVYAHVCVHVHMGGKVSSACACCEGEDSMSTSIPWHCTANMQVLK